MVTLCHLFLGLQDESQHHLMWTFIFPKWHSTHHDVGFLRARQPQTVSYAFIFLKWYNMREERTKKKKDTHGLRQRQGTNYTDRYTQFHKAGKEKAGKGQGLVCLLHCYLERPLVLTPKKLLSNWETFSVELSSWSNRDSKRWRGSSISMSLLWSPKLGSESHLPKTNQWRILT